MTARSRACSLVSALTLTTAPVSVLGVGPAEAAPLRSTFKVKTKIRDVAGTRWDAKNKPGLQPTRSTFTV